MTRNKVLFAVVTLAILTSAATAGWATLAWGASQPVATGVVKGISTEQQVTKTPTPPVVSKYPKRTTITNPKINAKEYVLYNPESGMILLESDFQEQVPIASTTKLMTVFLTEKYGNPDDILTVTTNDLSVGGSLMYLKAGEKITVRNLMYGAMMVSGNDAATVLGDYVGGKLLQSETSTFSDRIARHVQEMNATAKLFHLENTEYHDPAGLNDEGHSTALDLAKLAAKVNELSLVSQIIGTANTTVTDVSGKIKHDLKNSNRLVSEFNYQGVIGGKTGFTPAAGHCLVSAAKRDGVTLIAVVLNTYSTAPEASALENRKLLDWGFSSFTWE